MEISYQNHLNQLPQGKKNTSLAPYTGLGGGFGGGDGGQLTD